MSDAELVACAAKMRYRGRQPISSSAGKKSSRKQQKRLQQVSVTGPLVAANSKKSAHHQQQQRDSSNNSSSGSLWIRNAANLWVRQPGNVIAPSQRNLPAATAVSATSASTPDFFSATSQQAASSWSITQDEFKEVQERVQKARLISSDGEQSLVLDFEGTQKLLRLVRMFGSRFHVIADRFHLEEESSSHHDTYAADEARPLLSASLLQGHFGLVVSVLAEIRYEKLQLAVNSARRERNNQQQRQEPQRQQPQRQLANEEAGSAAESQEMDAARRRAQAEVLETVVMALAREHPIRHQSAAIGTAAEASVAVAVSAAATGCDAKRSERSSNSNKPRGKKKAAAAASSSSSDNSDREHVSGHGDKSVKDTNPAPSSSSACIPPSSMSTPLTVDPRVLLAREKLLQRRVEAISHEDCLGHAFATRLRALLAQASNLTARCTYDRSRPLDITHSGDLPSSEVALHTISLAERQREAALAHGEVATTIDDIQFLMFPRTKVPTSSGSITFLNDLEKYLEARLTPLVSSASKGALDRVAGLRSITAAATVIEKEAMRVRSATSNMKRIKEEVDVLRREMLAAATENAAGPTRRDRQE